MIANVSTAALDNFFCEDIWRFISFERSAGVLKDHLFVIQTKFIPLCLYWFSRDFKIFKMSAFIVNLVWILLISNGSSAANKIASTCLSASKIEVGNFKKTMFSFF